MLYCPHCDRELGPEHDDAGCRRKMSRRHFFGILGAAFGTVVSAPQALLHISIAPLSPEQIGKALLKTVFKPEMMDVAFSPIYDTLGDFVPTDFPNPHQPYPRQPKRSLFKLARRIG